MKEQLKKRGLDLVFLALAGLVGIGAFYAYVMITNHRALDAALIQVIQSSQQEQAETVGEVAPTP